MPLGFDDLQLDRWADDGGAPGRGEEHSSLNSNSPTETPSVYLVLAQHQTTAEWDQQALVRELHRWADIFNGEFALLIPEIALRVDWLSRSAFGHFRYGFNGFGLRGEIAINRRYLTSRDFWQVLGTLLHELVHAWQQAYGKPGRGQYHNKQFRDKARSLGLEVDAGGVTEYPPDSPFLDLLRRYGVVVPELPQPVVRQPGKSKLKLWTCGCTKVRVAVADFQARCLRPGCGNLFVRQED